MLAFKVLMVDNRDTFSNDVWRIRSWYVGSYTLWSTDKWMGGRCYCLISPADPVTSFVNHEPFPPEAPPGGCGIYVVDTFNRAWSWVGVIHTSHIISTAVEQSLKKDIGIFLVECAGRVVIHESGARAQMARIAAPVTGFVDPRLVEYLEREYGVLAVGVDDANIAVKYSFEEALA